MSPPVHADHRKNASAIRDTRCPHPTCPGCPLFSLPYSEQLDHKRKTVADAFGRHFGPPALPVPEIQPTRASPTVLGYRATAKLVFSRSGKTVQLGVYQRGSHEVVDVARCPVHHPLVTAGIKALRELLAKAPHFLSARIGGQGWLRYAALQASLLEEKLVVCLVTSSAEGEGTLRSLASRFADKLPALAGVVWNVNPSLGNTIFGEQWKTLWGEGALRERLGELIFRASPSSFLQANREQAGWVYRNAVEWLEPEASDRVIDLYSGVGGLALHLAKKVERVVAVEGSESACADARWTAEALGLGSKVSFEAGRVEDVLPRLATEGFRPQLVTLNPPRRGVVPLVVDTLRDLLPRRVLYVSCNPETLARDAAALCAGNRYRLTLIQPVDFFPQTEHVETVAVFQRVG